MLQLGPVQPSSVVCAQTQRPVTVRSASSGRCSQAHGRRHDPQTAVGSYIGKNNTSFDSRNYGFTKLSDLVRKQPYLEVKEAPDASGFVHLYVRARQ